MRKLLSILVLTLCITATYAFRTVTPSHKQLTYSGRIEKVDRETIKFYWPGSSVTINFIGTEIKAIFKNGKEDTYFYVIVDGKENEAKKIKADTIKSSILLAKDLKNCKHSVKLFKLSNNTSHTFFYGFELADGSKVSKATPLPRRKIEFYGNSITAGHGVDVLPGQGDSGSPQYFNNYWTYAARTARHFDAQYSCIARSGIGIMVSWFPEIMPEIYERTNPNDSTSKWDFSKYTPDIVVVNLFQNDSWLVNNPKYPQFISRFGTIAPSETFIVESYKNFIKKLRTKYPKSHLICALGSMDATKTGSLWPSYITKAVKEMNDSKIHTHFFPYKNTDGHPKKEEQKVMADDLIEFINKNIKW